jgi:hypothetical protein
MSSQQNTGAKARNACGRDGKRASLRLPDSVFPSALIGKSPFAAGAPHKSDFPASAARKDTGAKCRDFSAHSRPPPVRGAKSTLRPVGFAGQSHTGDHGRSLHADVRCPRPAVVRRFEAVSGRAGLPRRPFRRQVDDLTQRIEEKADEAGFIAVYPNGTSRRGRLLGWNAGNCCG